MSPQIVAEQIIDQGSQPESTLLEAITPDVIQLLVERVSTLKHQNANEALRVAKVAVAASDSIEDRSLHARAWIANGEALAQLHRHAESVLMYENAQAIYDEIDEQVAKTQLQVRMVISLFLAGESEQALQLAEEAMIACYELGAVVERDLARLEFSLGLIYMNMGRYDSALRAYGEAKGLLIRLGETVEAARVDINRANIYQEMDVLDKAQVIYEAARDALSAFPDYREQVAMIDLNLGMLSRRQGKYQHALRFLESAEKNGKTNHSLLNKIKLRRAFVYQNLGLFPEVIGLTKEIEPEFRQEKMTEELAEALQLLGNGYRDAGHTNDSTQLYIRSREQFEKLGNKLRILEITRELALTALKSRDLQTADELTQHLLNYQAMTLPPMLLGEAHVLRARFYMLSHALPADALREIGQAQRIATKYRLLEIAAQANALRAKLATDFDTAWAAYQSAIESVETLRSQLWFDEFHLGFMEGKLSIYADAIQLLIEHKRKAADLLHLLEMAQSAPLVQGKLALAESDRVKLNELRQAWHWQSSKLDDETDGAARLAINTTLKRLEQQISEIQRHASLVGRETPQLDALRQLRPHEFAMQIQAALPPETLLLQYFVSAENVYVCSVTHTTVSYQQLTQQTRVQRILQGWLHHISDLQFIADNPETSRQIAQRYLVAFYKLLAAPLKDQLATHANLSVVLPHQWHNLPFAAFFDGTRYLLESHQLRFLSAPSVVLEPPVKAAPDRPKALVIGTSDGGTLPYSIRETQLVADALGADWSCSVRIEDEAQSDVIFEQARTLNLLHISTHAVFRPDNPAFSWMQLADKRLTMAELYHAELASEPLVVLSACETGLGQSRGGGLAGIARALLTAGAAHLVVTLWRVESSISAELMQSFYYNLSGEQPSDVTSALRTAQLEFVKQLHPFFWAGYIFIQG